MISNSIFFPAIVGIASIGLLTQQAQAVTTTFADANMNNFTNAVNALGSASSVVFDFNNSSDGNAALTNGSLASGDGQVLTINGTNQGNLNIRGNAYGTKPLGNTGKQVAVASPDNSTDYTITFSLAQTTNYFGVYIGDQYDISDTSTYTLSANTAGSDTVIFDESFSIGGNGTAPLAVTDSAGTENLTVGNNVYNFFGIVDDTNTFSEVTLTMFDPSGGNSDNFVFDSVVVASQGDIAAAVPFEFSPSLGLVLVGLGFGGYKYRQAKLDKKNFSS